MKKDNSIKVSAVIIARNEEDNMGGCIKTLDFCDEVVVVDDDSEDATATISRSLGATVYTRSLGGDFSKQRNFGLSKARYPWVFFVDADERITPSLKKEILSEVSKKVNYTSGYYFRRIDHMWGQMVSHGEVGALRILRLARKNSGKWVRQVHEHWAVIGAVKTFSNPIEHYPHPTVFEFLREVNQRSTLHALANKKEGKKATIVKVIFYPIFKFIDNWIVKMGLLDGNVGFVIAFMMSFHSFLSWSKLWLIQKEKKK